MKPAKAKSVILLYMWGGPSQLETWDPKPDATMEIRGSFKPIRTTVPGLQIGEHFPELAKRAKRYAVIRSMSHTDPAHLSPTHHLMTGRKAARVNSDADGPSRAQWRCASPLRRVQRSLAQGRQADQVDSPRSYSLLAHQ